MGRGDFMSIILSEDKYEAIVSYARSNMLNLIATGSPASSVFRGQERTGIHITDNPAHFCLFASGFDEEYLYSIGKNKKDNVCIFNNICEELKVLQSNSNYLFEPFYHNGTKQPIILINLPEIETEKDRINLLSDIHKLVEEAYKCNLKELFEHNLVSAVTADFYDFGIKVRRDFDLAVKFINDYRFFLKQYKVIDETIRSIPLINVEEASIFMQVSILKETINNTKSELIEGTLHHLFIDMIKPSMSKQSCLFAVKLLNETINHYKSICSDNLNELRVEDYSSVEELEQEYIKLFETIYKEIERMKSSLDKEIGETIQYIKKHYKDQLTLTDIAKYIGFNKNYLCTKFKKEMGVTIHQYLIEVRMAHARKLLINDNESVDSVAYKSGFENALYFRSIFKKYNGLTPTEYRNITR
jgi:YesN/AraC family two-component response regulator